MELKEIVKIYFKYFSNKDLQNLENLFSENITLKDWDINVIGKQEVLKANKNIFESVESILVTLSKIYQDKNVVLCEIDILINRKEKLRVIDIIKFDENNKIKEILAYKQ